MSRSIVSNAGAFYRAGFNFLCGKSGLPKDRVLDLSPPVLSACFTVRPGLLPSSNPSWQVFFTRSLTLAGYYSNFYWPPVKSGMDWRGGRRVLQ
jgi:hypothetical protein